MFFTEIISVISNFLSMPFYVILWNFHNNETSEQVKCLEFANLSK